MQLTLQRKGNVLFAADEGTLASLRRLPDGAIITREWRKVRNPKHHRLRFAWVADLYAFIEHSGAFSSAEALREHITKMAGATIEHTNRITGEVTVVAKSWSYAAMDEAQFAEMLQHAGAYLVGDFAELLGAHCGWNDADRRNWEALCLV